MTASVGLIGDLLTQSVFSTKSKENSVCFIDTSTLIYLERLNLLEHVISFFSPATIDRVINEFGRRPKGLTIRETGPGSTDFLLVQQAAISKAAVFSEDKKVLQNAGRHGLEYYNTLMIVLALYYREEIDRRRCDSLLASLKLFAHYSKNVWAYGSQVYAFLDAEKSNIFKHEVNPGTLQPPPHR